MANFCFFTDHTLLNSQVNKPFGPTAANPNTEYRIQNLHSGTSPLPVFAITQGEILVQEVITNPLLVNIVLKPGVQPDFDFPKIEYIIYKGVLKSSLINGAEIAAEGTNDLTESIWQAQNKRNEKVEAETDINPMETPNANCLGINYADIASPPFEALDDSSLDVAFFNNASEFQLPSVQKGWEIGEFDSASFGVLIAFERIGQPHTFELARKLDSKVIVTTLGGAPTQVETFEYNHDKEKVLSYLDDAAFFGAFYSGKLDVKIGSEFEERSEEEIYDLLLSKYLNKNVVYLDVRNEFDTSFDYYLNYGRNIKASFTNGGTTTILNFYRDNWPILKLDLADFPVGNSSDKNFINLSLPQGSNNKGIVYLAKAFLDKRKFKKLLYKKKFKEVNFSDDFTLISPNKVGGGTTPITSYFHLVYIKRQIEDNLSTDFSPHPKHYLDFIFQIFQNPIPFKDSTDVIKYKTYDTNIYSNTLSLNGEDCIANVCYTEDNFNITLLVNPKVYLNGPKLRVNNTKSLTGESIKDNGHFLDLLNGRLANSRFSKQEMILAGEPEIFIEQQNSGLPTKNFFSINDPEYTSVLIKKSDFIDLFTNISVSSIQSKYGVWLYVENQENIEDDEGNPVTEITLRLSGLEYIGNNVSRKNLTTGIKLYTHGHL